MKIKVYILLLLCICLNIQSLTLLSSAKAIQHISDEEAVALLDEAWSFYLIAVRGHVFDELVDYNNEIKLNIGDSEISYWKVFEEKLPGGSYEAMKEYAKNIYCEDVAPSMYEYLSSFENELKIPTYIIASDGNLYSSINVTDMEYVAFKGYQILYPNGEVSSSLENFVIKYISGDENQATFYVRADIGYQEETNHWWMECKFVNTNNGWRIADSTFTDVLKHCCQEQSWKKELIPYTESPSTGDVSGERVAVIGAVSLACIIPAACLMRRRRRASAE